MTAVLESLQLEDEVGGGKRHFSSMRNADIGDEPIISSAMAEAREMSTAAISRTVVELPRIEFL